MQQKKGIAILGSTGSIGTQALDVIEAHPNPSKAMSDGKNSLDIKDLKGLLSSVIKINTIIKDNME